ncbi:phosphotriesterase [bacterium]|nr:phosphotriesterase [bacterium]
MLFVCSATVYADLSHEGKIMTVMGPIEPSALGKTLPHEHVLVDFIGAEQISPDRYDRDAAFQKILPFLKELKPFGVKAFVECTPAYIGRDAVLCLRLSKATGLHILTNTGYYGAANDKCVPKHAYEETPQQLAARWVKEWEQGIGQTGIYPGFIKIGVDSGPLSAIDKKLVQAAALAHKKTGLTIAAHTGNAKAGREELAVIQEYGVRADAFIWVHADNVKDSVVLVEAAKKGAWIELDKINKKRMEIQLDPLKALKREGLLDRVMLSHDAGWYRVGQENGGTYRPHTDLFTDFIPLLKENGFTDGEIQQMIVKNPQQAFQIKKRLADQK